MVAISGPKGDRMSDEDLARGLALQRQQIEEREREHARENGFEVADDDPTDVKPPPKRDPAERFRAVGEHRLAAALKRLEMVERLGGPSYSRTAAQTDYVLGKLREAILRIEKAFAPRRSPQAEVKFPE